MKTKFYIVIVAAMGAISCSSSKYLSASYSDDVYHSTTVYNTPSTSTSNQDNIDNTSNYFENNQNSLINSTETVETRKTSDKEGNTYVTNNYYSFDPDDYYDYEYTARIRRFHNVYIGCGYYDAFYTNLYWYTYDPFDWGISIYFGYHWWPFYTYYYYPAYYAVGFYYPWYYNPWWYYHPYYYYGGFYGFMATGMDITMGIGTVTGMVIGMDITMLMHTIITTIATMVLFTDIVGKDLVTTWQKIEILTTRLFHNIKTLIIMKYLVDQALPTIQNQKQIDLNL